VRQSRSVVTVRASATKDPNKIGKTELKKEIADKTDLTDVKAGQVLDATLALIVEHVTAGRSVVIPGFGTFEKRHRNARQGRNPQTGEPLSIGEKDVPGFSAGSSFKQCVSEGSTEKWKVPSNGAKPPKASTTKAAAKK
jgi:nucleoid DNA-binding protein